MSFRSLALNAVIGLMLLISLLTPCQPAKIPEGSENQQLAAAHYLYTIVPRQRSQIQWYDFGRWTLWAVVGNDDDGIFGERVAGFHPELAPSMGRALLWTLRNPLHNFCFYVIGSADRINNALKLLEITPEGVTALDYQSEADTVFAGKHSSFLLALHGGKPFFSFCWEWSQSHKTRFYLGWRCRGNFGAKCVL